MNGRSVRMTALILAGLLVSAPLAAGCARPSATVPAPLMADTFYAARCDASLYFSTTEEIGLYIPFLRTPRSDAYTFSFAAPVLSGPDLTLPATTFGLLPGGGGTEAEAVAVSVGLKLSEGGHLFDSIRLTFGAGGTGTWAMGTWRIMVLPPSPAAPPVRVGKHTIVAGRLEYYSLELTNISPDPLSIKDFSFDLPGITLDRIVPRGGGAAEAAPVLAPGETRTLEFWFRNGSPTQTEFFIVKPLLLVEAGGVDSAVFLPQATFFPLVTRERLERIVSTGARQPGP